MKVKHALLLSVALMAGCSQQSPTAISVEEEDWSKRAATAELVGPGVHGESYLSVYSEIYNYTQQRKNRLTATISMRNVSKTDTIHLLRADYFDTAGAKVRTYFDYPIYVRPMETLEIVIAHDDVEGGTGSNFLFEWRTPASCPEPLFEAVMSMLRGNQGMAFTTHARRTK